jgi:hypothetical protein
MAAGWAAAADNARQAGTFHRRDLLLAGVPIRLDLAGDALAGIVLPAFEVHPSTDLEPRVHLEAYDAAATGAPMPAEPRVPVGEDWGGIHSWPEAPGRPAGRWYARNLHGQAFVHVDGGPDRFAVADARLGPWWEPGAPLRQPLAWAMAGPDTTFLHAAAVGRPDGVVLLVGAGGSGKSSTALSALVSGLHFIGDDYCILRAGDPPEVHTLFGVAKVAPDQLAAVDPDGLLRPHVLSPGAVHEDPAVQMAAKAVIATSRWPEGRFLAHAPVRAVVLPDRRSSPGLTPIAAAEALRHLAPTSLLQLRGEGASSLRLQADLVRRVPCFRLGLLPDRQANPPVLERLLTDLADGRLP